MRHKCKGRLFRLLDNTKYLGMKKAKTIHYQGITSHLLQYNLSIRTPKQILSKVTQALGSLFRVLPQGLHLKLIFHLYNSRKQLMRVSSAKNL